MSVVHFSVFLIFVNDNIINRVINNRVIDIHTFTRNMFKEI